MIKGISYDKREPPGETKRGPQENDLLDLPRNFKKSSR